MRLPVANSAAEVVECGVELELTRCGRKNVAAPASKKVCPMDLSLMAHTTSQPLTSYLKINSIHSCMVSSVTRKNRCFNSH